jgi:hypothetical protein
MNIINESMLTQALNSIAQIAIVNVSDKVLKQLQDDIKRDVYEHSYFPNFYYVGGSGIPTFDFLRAWKWDAMKRDIMSATRELFYDYFNMIYDGENYIHGNRTTDRREELAEDLNVSGSALNQDFNTRKQRAPFWSNFLYEMFQEGQLETWFDEELLNLGFIKI